METSIAKQYKQVLGRREDTRLGTYKILHLIGGGEIGGAEQHVLTLVKNLDPNLFFPAVGCLLDGPFARLTESENIVTVRFPMKHPLDLSTLPKLIRWARAEGIGLFHTHGSRANLLGRLAGKWLRLPVVSTVHSSLKQDYLSPRAARVALALDSLTLPWTSGIITVSDYLAREVTDRGGKNIKTIYNGQKHLPPLNFSEARTEFRKKWKIPADALVIGSIARMHPTKGLGYLVEAAALLQSRFPRLHVLLIGDGPLFQEIKSQLVNQTLPYTMTGFLPEAYKALPAMDLFVLPSISEGMGLVLLEAMQARIPIVATNAGGIPEVIRSGQDGLLVPPADPHALASACAVVLENPILRNSLIESGSKRWTRFSILRMTKDTEKFYLDILERRVAN